MEKLPVSVRAERWKTNVLVDKKTDLVDLVF